MKIICKNCGAEMDESQKFCSDCGQKLKKPEPEANTAPVQETVPLHESMPVQNQAPVENTAPVIEPVSILNQPQPGKVKKNPNLLTIILPIAVAVLGVIACIVVGVCVRSVDEKKLATDGVTLGEMEAQLEEVKTDLESSSEELEKINAQIEAQSQKVEPLKEIYDKSLAAGTYTVGVDLEAGVYHFTYKTRDGEETSWGDYIYVINKGSKGSQETMGGTKFDYRVEGSTNGEKIDIKLDYGSKVTVDANNGYWQPQKTSSK